MSQKWGPLQPVKILGPVIALICAGAYVILKLRDARWKLEMKAYVGQQIRTRLIEMIPRDLDVSDAEKEQLAASEVYRELTGVFWEAVDRNDVLRSHKEHFYSNGISYSTAIDVFLIFGFAGFCYSVLGLLLWDERYAYAATILIFIAMASRWFAIPRARRQHLNLSREQLDLLAREEGEFVANRFREIVLGWRRARALR